ncbi:MAG: S-layer homology domain-containing protein [Candidatus Margulisiibacteriota bacterium]
MPNPFSLGAPRIRRALLLLLGTSAFFILGISTAFAALNDYTVTGGNITTLPDVGAVTASITPIVITDSAGDEFGLNEVVQVVIPPPYKDWVFFDQTVAAGNITVTNGGTCAYGATPSALSYQELNTEGRSTKVNITLSGAACAGGGTITISGLKVDTIYNRTSPTANALITIDNITTATGVPISTSTPTDSGVNFTDANASLALSDPGNKTVGTVGVTTLTFTTSERLFNGDTVSFTAPANLNVADVAYSATNLVANGDATLACSDSGQVVTCTVSATVAAANYYAVKTDATITMTGIISIYETTSQNMNDFMVKDSTPEPDMNINTDATVAVTATTAADAGATITLSTDNAVVGTAGNTDINFTLPLAIGDTDTVAIVMPAQLNVAGATFVSEDFAGGVNAFSGCVGSTQTITCTSNGAHSGTGKIVVSGIYSTYVSTTGSTSFTVTDTGKGVVASDLAVALATNPITVGALASTNVEPSIVTNVTYSMATVTFTSSAPISNSGIIKVTFPAGWGVGDVASATAVSGVSGTLTTSVSGQVVTVTVGTGATTASPSAPVAVSFRLYNVLTPATSGTGGTYQIKTYHTDGTSLIEQDTSVTADTIYVKSENVNDTVSEPSDFTVVDNPDGAGLLLSWNDPDDDSTFIQIFRGISPNPVDGSAYTTVAIGTEEYVDTALEDGDVVTYMIRATNGSKYSDYADDVTLTYASSSSSSDDSDDSSDDTGSDDASDDTTDDTSDDTGTDDDTTDEDTATTLAVFGDSADIPTWAENAIATLVDAGVIEGNDDGTFAPADSLNRAEAGAMLWRVLVMGDPTEATMKPFTDVALGEWYTNYIAELKDLDLVEGDPEGTYRPSESINRAEFVVLALRVYDYLNPDLAYEIAETDAYVDLDTTAWYADDIILATGLGFVEGSDCTGGKCFNAGSEINRAEASQVLYNMFGADL